MAAHWKETGRSDPRARALADRHYSRKTPGSPQFLPPATALVLLNEDATALLACVRAKDNYRRDHINGIELCIFRNESAQLSSAILLEAETAISQRWPGDMLFTYVDPQKIRSSNPGCCFKKAGWQRTGTSRSGKLLFTKKLNAP
jgi:hypothetical protein